MRSQDTYRLEYATGSYKNLAVKRYNKWILTQNCIDRRVILGWILDKLNVTVWTENPPMAGSYKNGNKFRFSTISREFIHQLSDCQFLKKDYSYHAVSQASDGLQLPTHKHRFRTYNLFVTLFVKLISNIRTTRSICSKYSNLIL